MWKISRSVDEYNKQEYIDYVVSKHHIFIFIFVHSTEIIVLKHVENIVKIN